MRTKIAGALVCLVGICAAAFAAWGLTMTAAMATASPPQSFNAEDWSVHWRLWGITLIVLGLALVWAGVALIYGKRSGFILLAAVALVAALFPWLLSIVGFARYAFEEPRMNESLLYLTVGAGALLGHYRWMQR